MRLVSLEIDGFKSFAHKTTIKFQPGMTGIIGPNGSGKSNVIEALRWVMGEQSAKTLRGGKMVDVIFNGSKNHRPLNRAVVKMTLDNSDHYLQSEYSEITVTRKLYRNGDSEYLINNHQVRLKDIVNLFIDSGIGRESFSIISQGRVAQIFNGQSSDRRRVIETVAGVAKYKQNKVTAEKRLQETSDRLDRVNDIVVELERRLDPLKEESSLAQDYLEQKRQLDKYDRTLTVRQVTSSQHQLQNVRGKLNDAQRMNLDYDQQTKDARAKLQQFQEQRQRVVQQKDQAQHQVTTKVAEIAKLQNQQSLSSIRQEQRQKEQQRLQKQKQQLSSQLQSVQQQLGANNDRTSQLRQEIDDQQADLQNAQSLSAQVQGKKLQDSLEQLQGQQVELMQQITTAHNERVYLQQNHQRSANVAKQDEQNLVNSRQELQKVTEQLKDGQNNLQGSRQKLNAINQKLTQENDHRQRLQGQYDQAQKNWYQALGNVQSAERQVKSYQAMVADYTGYYTGVQNVLKARQQFPGLAGSVSEIIKVPERYTTAIETVLGSQLQQLIVDNQETGKQIIHYLVAHRGGRVTILPMDSIRAGWQPSTLPSVRQLPGFIGEATQLIQYPDKFSRVIDHLLSTTVVVDNLDHATTISKAGHHQLRVITLDGQLINASGAMTGGASRRQRVGLLSQKQQLDQLRNRLKDEQSKSTVLEGQVQKLTAAREANQQSLQKLQAQVSEIQKTVSEQATTVRLLQQNQADLKRRVQALEFQSGQQSSQHQSYNEQIAANDEKTHQLNQQLTSVKDREQEIRKQLQALESNSADQEQLIRQLEQDIAVKRERLKQLKDRHAELVSQQASVSDQLDDVDHQLSQLDATNEDDQSQQVDTKDALQNAQQVLDLARQTVEDCSTKQEQLDQQITEQTQSTERLQELSRSVLNDLSELSDRKGRLETQIDQGLNKLSEQYSMTLTDAEQNQSDVSDEELHRQIKLLKRGLADIGNVNVGAIDEYKEVSSRYEFLTGQKNDLLTAKEQLEQTMQTMDDQVKQRFTRTFKQVSESFATTFQQIFNGGQAKLVLTEPDDPLQTGVDIMAQPPGKKNQQLSLLSGGEKALTAIALLFAILKVRPVPFVILDEPEAALDDVNVDRFANYLEKFGHSGPQFIVITHRKGTMRNADVLYGVTMQESGISEVVSVDVTKTLGED